MPDQLSVSVRSEEGATIVCVSGELDLASHRKLQGALDRALQASPELILLDLGELEFVDVAGLRSMLRSQERARAAGKRFGLAAPPPGVKRLLALTGQNRAFRTFDSVAEALRA